MSTWSVDFDNHLIELVRANPSLYERELRSSPYDAHKKKTELWCSIATSLKTDVKTCITRWNYMRDKLRRELQKEQSDWSLLDKLRFVAQHKQNSSRNNERQQQQTVSTSSHQINASWRALSPNQLIEHDDEDDALQEAMDEQQVATTVMLPTTTTAAAASPPPPVAEDLMKRIEALLQGLGANRCKAEKKIVAYLCKCTLRSLNEEQIDDIFI